MSEAVEKKSHQSGNVEAKNKSKSPEISVIGSGISRERSFVRTNSQQQHHNNKRRSLAFASQANALHQQQLRMKPALEIYRPPNVRVDNKLNVHAQEFTMAQNTQAALGFFPSSNGPLLHSKSSSNMQQQLQQLAARRHAVQLAAAAAAANPHHAYVVAHPLQMHSLSLAAVQTPQVSPVGSVSANNQSMSHRVKFALDQNQSNGKTEVKSSAPQVTPLRVNGVNALQRSKSLSSADTLARGIASLGLTVGTEANDIGTFKTEIQAVIDQALIDPNQLNARSLMELANQIIQRAVEGRRYALPTSRFCISIIAKEQKETFLEALLNTCRQWYQERDKVLGPPQSIKSAAARPRFTAFMAFLTEMFCQLKRRQLQLRTKCDGVPPPLVLLTVLAKCCEDCVKPPVRSLSEIECLFYVLTCIGRDLEMHLPQLLENLLSSVRDAFLNASASAPAIRRTLLQLIELQASHWQLPGNTVLYYYPSNK